MILSVIGIGDVCVIGDAIIVLCVVGGDIIVGDDVLLVLYDLLVESFIFFASNGFVI